MGGTVEARSVRGFDMNKGVWLPMLLGAVVFGAIGFGMGFVLGSSDSAPEVIERSSEAPEEREADSAPPQADRDRPAGERSARRPKRPRDRSEGGAAKVLLDQVTIPEIPTGSGVITGHVRTKDATPVEGVVIKLTPAQTKPLGPPDQRPYDEIPIAELLERHARSLLWQRSSRRETVTDAEGAYRFEQCADTGHSLTAKLESWQIQPVNWQIARDAKSGAEVDFTATETVKIEARLTLPDGTEPEQAQLEFKQSRSTHSVGWTPGKPFAYMAPGKYDVRALSGARGEFGSEKQPVELIAGEPFPALVLELKGRPGIHGKVVLPEGEVATNLRIYLAAAPEGSDLDEVQLKNGGKQAWANASRGLTYSFPDLAPGRYAIGAGRSYNGPLTVMDFVTVREGPVEHDLEVPELARSDYVLVHALDGEGNVVREFTARLRFQSKRRSSSGGGTVLPGPDGSWRVLHQEVADDADGQRIISITSPTLGTLDGEYRKGPASEITLRFTKPGQLVATARGHEGKRYAGMLQVNASRIVREGTRTRNVGIGGGQFDAEGKYVFAALQPGEYRVTLSVGNRRRVTIATQTVRIAAGENTALLTVPELSTITVYGASGNVYARSTSGENRINVHGVQGKDKWVLDFLPPGEYEIRSSGGKRQTVSVPGTTEVRF